MNDAEALRRFTEDNIPYFTSEDFTREGYKSRHRAFFIEKHNKRYGIPTLKDIATCLIKSLATRGVQPDKIITLIQTLPMLREAGNVTQDDLVARIKRGEYKSKLSADDLKSLKATSAFEAVERHKSKEIADAARQQLITLEQQLKEKKDEYDSLSSVLDEQTFSEPDFDPTIEDVKPWWERFYLKANPFPRKDGLSAVDQELYESVVVKTQPFKDILAKFARNSDFLFNTAFLLAGDFGFGKTTFMDYLSYFLIRKNILPIRITAARIHPSASAFLDAFYSQLKTRLHQELTVLGTGSVINPDLDIEDLIIEMCRLIVGRKSGIVILLDDYHKHTSAQPHIFEFLGMLQILKDNITRAELKVGFIVSGLPEWQYHLTTNARLTGFLDSPALAMPVITPETIAAVFNQRLAAYCYDTHARTLRVDFVETIFDVLGDRASYRDYLSKIISELEHNNVSIVDVPIAISDTELAAIKATLEGDSALKSSFNKLVFESKFKRYTGQQVVRCLEMLVQAALQAGVSEDDGLFTANRYYFQHLRDLSLIQKRKAKSPQGALFRWVVHSRLQNAIDAIAAKYRRSISDYLLKLYGGGNYTTPATVGQESGVGTEMNALARVLSDSSLNRAVMDSITTAQRMYESIQLVPSSADQHDGIITRAKLSLDHLLNALFYLDTSAPIFATAQMDQHEERVRFHWIGDEGLQEAFRRFSIFRVDRTRLQFEAAHKCAADAIPVVADHFSKLHLDITDPLRPVPFRHRAIRHTEPEIELFKLIEANYFSSDSEKHFSYVEKMTNYLEERFRAFLFVTCTGVFGEEKYFDYVPKGEKKYAIRNSESRAKFSAVGNLFEGLTRPQFRSIFVDSEVKKLIVDAVSVNWSAAEWRVFWDLFVEENIATSHKQHGAYSPANRERYARYCRMAEELLASLNVLISGIFSNNAFILVEDPTKSRLTVGDCMFRYAFVFKDKRSNDRIVGLDNGSFKHAELISDHSIDQEVYRKVMDNVLAKLDGVEKFAEDLLEIEYLRNHYDVSSAQFLSCLAFGHLVDRVIDIVPWFGSSVLVKRRALK